MKQPHSQPQPKTSVCLRKGPWTEQEDMKLVWFVRLFGERRWDFLAKVSGLNRTGKSCRLRWVNYLHPDLKRGRMTPDEERLVVHLHATFGNRWSRIAKSMPGRTDNEIKNYWRTHMRKLHNAADNHRADPTSSSADSTSASSSSTAPASSSSSSNIQQEAGTARASSSSSSSSNNHQEAATAPASSSSSSSSGSQQEAASAPAPCSHEQILYTAGAAMDQLLIWNDMDCWSSTIAAPLMPPSSPIWDYCSASLWE